MVNSTSHQHNKNERFSTVRHLVAKPKAFTENNNNRQHLFHWQPVMNTAGDTSAAEISTPSSKQNKKQQRRTHRRRQLMNDLLLQTNEELAHKHNRRRNRKDKKQKSQTARKRKDVLRNNENHISMKFESTAMLERKIKEKKQLSKTKAMTSRRKNVVHRKDVHKESQQRLELDNRVMVRNDSSAADVHCHYCEHICVNTRCHCFNGFRLRSDGRTCKDINECRETERLCSHECQNLPGSYRCLCPDGYRSDGNVCRDVNECLLNNGHGPCQDTCINTVGAYRCTCARLSGTRLAADGRSCVGVNVTCTHTAGCSHECVSIRGRSHCLCPATMQLGVDWKTCEHSMGYQESLNLT